MTWLATRHEVKATRKAERASLIVGAASELWAAADLQWEAAQDLGWAVHEIQCEREAGQQAPKGLWARRELYLTTKANANARARSALGRLKLLGAPEPILSAASDLVQHSGQFRAAADQPETARSEALSAFERAVEDHERNNPEKR